MSRFQHRRPGGLNTETCSRATRHGYLYVRRALAEKMHPPYLARFGVDLGGPMRTNRTSVTAHSSNAGGASLDLGNYNYAGVCAIDASLNFYSSWERGT
jgi:selenocysteine lyase/cysteine desulfurase